MAAFEEWQVVELENYLAVDCQIEVERGGALLYAIATDDTLYLILKSPGKTAIERVPIRRADLEELAKLHSDNVQNFTTLDYQVTSQRLYQLPIAPIAARLREGETLRILSDRVLRGIPFASLLDEEGRFLVERFPSSYALVVEAPTPPRRSGQRVAIFGVTDRLPAVKEEVAAIDRLLPATLFLDENFSLANFARAFGGRRYASIHVASSTVFSGSARDSYIRAGEGKRISLDDFARALAIESGTAPSLVVFSACETAAGSDPLLGFAGVVLQSNAAIAVGSVLPVNDEAAADLMKSFYLHLDSGETIPGALQLAQAEMALADNHPFFWAAFIVVERN